MDEQSVLALGALTLAGSAMGLLVSFRSNPLLRGLNWMSAALVIGSAAAGTFIFTIHYAAFRPLGDLLVLLAFLLCDRATRLCTGQGEGSNRIDACLLCMQLVASMSQWLHAVSYPVGILLHSCLLAIVFHRAGRVSQHGAQGKFRNSALFAAGMLYFMILPDLFHGVASVLGALQDPGRSEVANTLTYGCYIVGGTALAFTLFSRTTTRLTEELEQAASTDPLTRVFNRRAFLEWCDKEWNRSAQTGLAFSILLIDLDHFKRVNDSYGHHMGDAVLCAIVEHIQNAVRGIDVVCRWGGEEFAVLLPNAPQESTRIVAERVQRSVRGLSSSPLLAHQGDLPNVRLTVSIGAGTWTGTGDSIDAILRRADAALYQAKESGRDRIILDSAALSSLPVLASSAPALTSA